MPVSHSTLPGDGSLIVFSQCDAPDDWRCPSPFRRPVEQGFSLIQLWHSTCTTKGKNEAAALAAVLSK